MPQARTKLSVDDLKAKLRDAGFTEDEMWPAIGAMMQDPEMRSMLKDYDLSEARPKSKTAGPEGNAATRFAKGFASPVTDLFSANNLTRMAVSSSPFTDPDRSARNTNQLTQIAGSVKDEGALQTARGMVGGKAFDERGAKGDRSGQVGVAAGQSLLWAAPFMRFSRVATGADALEETTALGEGTKIDPVALDAAKNLSRDVSTILDSQIANIDKGMAGQFVNVKSLRAAIDKSVKMMDKVERAPGMQVRDISAAKDVVERLTERSKQGMLTWNDARQFYKEIGNAATSTKGASAIRNALSDINSALKDELQAAAKTAGHESAFNKWMKDYADLKAWQRGYAKKVKGQTPGQMEAERTATPGTKIPKTNITVGGSNKTAKIAKSELKAAHKGLEELTKRVKSTPSGIAPKPQAPPPTPTAPAAPAQGGGQPPVGSPAPAAPPAPGVQGGSGTFVRNPRPNPVEHPAAPKMPPKFTDEF